MSAVVSRVQRETAWAHETGRGARHSAARSAGGHALERQRVWLPLPEACHALLVIHARARYCALDVSKHPWNALEEQSLFRKRRRGCVCVLRRRFLRADARLTDVLQPAEVLKDTCFTSIV